jgi:hypothetical protein
VASRLTGYKAGLYRGYADRMALSAHVPDLAALEVLLSVARTGSLNSAARQIGVSQRVIWTGGANPPAGAARDLVTHIVSRRPRPGPG